jgi:hypothetical protein
MTVVMYVLVSGDKHGSIAGIGMSRNALSLTAAGTHREAYESVGPDVLEWLTLGGLPKSEDRFRRPLHHDSINELGSAWRNRNIMMR